VCPNSPYNLSDDAGSYNVRGAVALGSQDADEIAETVSARFGSHCANLGAATVPQSVRLDTRCHQWYW
jgi:hypothetical protein